MSWVSCQSVADLLAENHYLGPTSRGLAWHDRFGAIVIAPPTARRLPRRWLELSRWCLVSDEANNGSRQWGAFIRALRALDAGFTTIVSYSDPAHGHDGALYRACNWWWAPTWHRLRPPPTGNGAWSAGRQEPVKDRWVFAARPDAERVAVLTVQDASILRRSPHLRYREPGGVSFKLYGACK